MLRRRDGCGWVGVSVTRQGAGVSDGAKGICGLEKTNFIGIEEFLMLTGIQSLKGI